MCRYISLWASFGQDHKKNINKSVQEHVKESAWQL